ncbi:MAG: tetratricopeptide repeat protein [Candidatus Binatia bacterium]
MRLHLVALAAILSIAVGAGLWLRAHRPSGIDVGAVTAEGIRLEEQGDLDGAAARYQAALAADDGAREARARLAMIRFKQAKWEEAVPLMTRAAEENPADGEMLINLGTALLQLDRNEEGVVWLQKAVSVVPDSPAAHNNLGVALAKEQRWEEAAAEFQRTLELKPDHRSAGRSLEMVRAQIPAKVR